MDRIFAALLALALLAAPAIACPFCAGEARSRLTLRQQFAQARVVVRGELKNPRFDTRTDEGTTELHATAILKDDPVRGGQSVIIVRSYLPVVGNAPRDFLAFCSAIDGKLDPTFGLPATTALVDYLKAAVLLNNNDPAAKLGFFFEHLDSPEAAIAADAFYEFARASEADIMKAAKRFDSARVRKMMGDSTTPAERLGVFAFLLGITGGPADLAFLAGFLNENPRSERTTAAFGGLLAGYILLNPTDGWPYAAALLGDAKQPFSVRLSTIGTVRFFQNTKGTSCKADVLRCCAALLPSGELADQAIEDLRRWGYWDLTPRVLDFYGKPTHAAPIVRNSIVRYALTCPEESARQFIAALRRTDPKLVETVESRLELDRPGAGRK